MELRHARRAWARHGRATRGQLLTSARPRPPRTGHRTRSLLPEICDTRTPSGALTSFRTPETAEPPCAHASGAHSLDSSRRRSVHARNSARRGRRLRWRRCIGDSGGRWRGGRGARATTMEVAKLLHGAALVEVYGDFKHARETSGAGLSMIHFVRSFLKHIPAVAELEQGVRRGQGGRAAALRRARTTAGRRGGCRSTTRHSAPRAVQSNRLQR